ncbi:unnamed protein product [Adineta steineri]|uniref:Uncharacterized protein n=1 Tax=Adineta steineri TaxID=433720 RepID=A0A815NCK1_9BILA|nr:unnamed protein product [Adineta steineri]CAF0854023.1 unnamed protein product [Adineta steineri]CAF1436383.1 unnamed protein product [Adineta steineri]CAF1436405.1 unnamed protein product [Adineta steineri]CAF1516991.1 unnamed protein product [Adineta steineri]
MHGCVELLKEVQVKQQILSEVNNILKKKGQTSSIVSIDKAIRNAISLLSSRKKEKALTILSIYLPMNSIEHVSDTVVPSISSDEDLSSTNISDNEDSSNSTSSSPTSPSLSNRTNFCFSPSDNILKVDFSFEYLEDYFKHSLTKNNKPMTIDKILTDICTYVFLDLRAAVNIRELKNEISLQISHTVKHARRRADSKSIIRVLRSVNLFSFIFKSIKPLKQVQSIIDFVQYQNSDNKSPILLIRKINDEIDILQFYPSLDEVEITFNEKLVQKALSSFNVLRTVDVEELSNLIQTCALSSNLKLNIVDAEEILKTKILFDRTSLDCIKSSFLTATVKQVEIDQNLNSFHNAYVTDPHSFDSDDLDAIIGRTYTTRGIKRSYEEDPISIEPNRNMYRRNKILTDKRDLLHLKDTYHFTDSALKAIFQYIQSKKKLYSLKEIEKLRKQTNAKFPILFTSTSAYVKFEYAVRTAIFVARKYEPKLEQHDTLNIRFNMDGTLIGNKHIVAISVNCIEGGHSCQTAKNLVPLGLFEVQKENTELLRTSLPAEFINDIKSVKYIAIGAKNIRIRIRLGGDLMNAVYVFGLAGFSSNYPCIFCTQHKDDLHVTEDTAYDKTITEGKGKNKTIITVHVDATSYHDTSKRARSLREQISCLAKQTNELGYKCEPLFGDLFDYQDYCVDTLHMKLRVFDVILKDILSYASRTGKYGGEHLAIIEQKVKILNRHCEKTVGKRFFFQVELDDKNKTIASHGKLSGHLQDLFFIDSFPYDEILSGEIAKSARAVVNKFKEVLFEVKHTSVKRKGVLKRLSLEFVKEFRQSGLRTTVTPYIHIIGNHLHEFHEFNDLGDYNMQGVEKSNDVLSRLYFSSTNPARNPLLTMLQKLYRMLEMNFQDEHERDAMTEFARTGVYDFIDDDKEELRSPNKDHVVSRNSDEDSIDSETESEEHLDSSRSETENDTETEDTLVWAPEKRFKTKPVSRSDNRFKCLRRS